MGVASILLPSLPAYSSHILKRPLPRPRTPTLHLRIRPCITRAVNEDNNIPAPSSPPSAPPDAVEIRFRRGSRKRAKLQGDESLKPRPPPKDWEAMTLGEKAVDLYMGEKGMLFWLNKFAYASIFIIIGGWILFRFVGPSVGLYQLDTPPLSPTSILNGS